MRLRDRRRRAAGRYPRAADNQHIDRRQQHQHDDAEHPARRAPAAARDHVLDPGQHDQRAHADTREGDADGQRPPAHEPVGQVLRLHGVGHAVCAAADQHAEIQVELPGRPDGGGSEQPRREHDDTELDDEARPAASISRPTNGLIAAEPGSRRRTHRRPARGPSRTPRRRRKHQGEGGACRHAEARRNEGDRDDDPAIEDGEAGPQGCTRDVGHVGLPVPPFD